MGDEGDEYRVVTGSAYGTAPLSEETGTFSDLRNSLKGSLSVQKQWEDGKDPWGQRPDAVYVVLQAKVGDGNWAMPMTF